jgi:hypothetical protein
MLLLLRIERATSRKTVAGMQTCRRRETRPKPWGFRSVLNFENYRLSMKTR